MAAVGRSPAVTRSSQQRGSAAGSRALQSTPTRVTLSTGGIAPLLLHGCPPPRCVGRPKVITPFHLSGDSHINLAEEQAHYRI